MPQLKKVIRKRTHSRNGNDKSRLGFVRLFMLNDVTGRSNQKFKCLHCGFRTPKKYSIIHHCKSVHPQEREITAATTSTPSS